jgi:hypothetical protein
LAKYSELIKNFDKIRDYMRDFFIYGCRTRCDYSGKSLRTYDNEKRRIESWLGEDFKTERGAKGKVVSVSIDSGRLSENPLYNCHRSKSFTDNDIRLHFTILDLLEENSGLAAEEITDRILSDYGMCFDCQTVRNKLKEYCNEGILICEKVGKKALFYKSTDTFDRVESVLGDINGIPDMLKFFSEQPPFGFVGNTLLKSMKITNDTFLNKHSFIVHTLDDLILSKIITAIEQKRYITAENFGRRGHRVATGIPMQIHCSSQTGRNYAVLFDTETKRFFSMRLDYIKSVKLGEVCESYDMARDNYLKNAPNCWGISFGGVRKGKNGNTQHLKMVLSIDESKEKFVLDRLRREGRGGRVSRIGENLFCYENDLFDANESSPWIKTFIGRIVEFHTDDKQMQMRFYDDMRKLAKMYGGD